MLGSFNVACNLGECRASDIGAIFSSNIASASVISFPKLGIAGSHVFDGTIDDIQVELSQSFVLGTFGIAIGEGVGLVQIRQNLDGILLGAQISEHPVKGFLTFSERTSISSPSKVIRLGFTPNAQAWSKRPQRLLVRNSPK